MDLQARKYQFIKEVFSIEKESIIDALERVLKQEKEADIEISEKHKSVLDERLESYENNPDDLLEWKAMKDNW